MTAKTIAGKTVAGNHEELLGQVIVLDGWQATITDTTETSNGTVYVGVRAHAAQATYLEKFWRKLEI